MVRMPIPENFLLRLYALLCHVLRISYCYIVYSLTRLTPVNIGIVGSVEVCLSILKQRP